MSEVHARPGGGEWDLVVTSSRKRSDTRSSPISSPDPVRSSVNRAEPGRERCEADHKASPGSRRSVQRLVAGRDALVFERKLPCPAGGPKDGLDNTCDRIYMVGRDGKGLKALVPCGFDVDKPFPGTCVGARTPAWSPDGSKIAFRYALVDREYVGSFNTNIGIWIANADGTGRRQVTQLTPGSSWDREPEWSPDGTKLAFVRDDLERKAEAVFTVNVDGAGLFQVTPWKLTAGTHPD